MIPPPVANAAPFDAQVQAWESKTQASGNWFFWIAGLTLLNLVTALLGRETGFAVSLMPPMALGYYAVHDSAHKSLAIGIALIVGLLCIGAFVLLGLFGRKGARWALVTGMALYGIDLLFWALGQGWLAVILHGYALWRIGVSLPAAASLGAARRQAQQAAASAAPVYAWGAAPESPPAVPGVWPPAPQDAPAPAASPLTPAASAAEAPSEG